MFGRVFYSRTRPLFLSLFVALRRRLSCPAGALACVGVALGAPGVVRREEREPARAKMDRGDGGASASRASSDDLAAWANAVLFPGGSEADLVCG